jgi:hypothetical protein
MADLVRLTGGALISVESSTSTDAGKAGDISIIGRNAVEIAASSVTSAADHAEGGSITIQGDQVHLGQGTLISAKSSGTGNAGSLSIIAFDVLTTQGSVISTGALQADGGDVLLAATSMLHLTDTTVTTSVGTGQGTGGNISVDPQFVILDHSQILAEAFGGPGGNISIVADVFLTQASVISASSALSTPGTIDVQARITDISGNVAHLPDAVGGPAAVLRASCATRFAGGNVSSLVISGREGVPPEPKAVLASPIFNDAALIQGQAVPRKYSLWLAGAPCAFSPH